MNNSYHKSVLKRRVFIKNSVVSAGTLMFLTPDVISVIEHISEGLELNRAINTKLRIKPVLAGIVHRTIYEGPCRPGSENPLSADQEKEKNTRLIKIYNEQLKPDSFSPDIEITNPVYFEFDDSWIMKNSQWDKLDRDIDNTDVFFFPLGTGIVQVPAVKIGERYKKPIIFYAGKNRSMFFPEGVDAVSHLSASNIEGHVVFDEEELSNLLYLMQVRKAIQNTRILRIIEYKTNNVNGNFKDVGHLKNKFGIDTLDLRIGDIVNEFDNVLNDLKIMKQVNMLTDKLIKNAERVNMQREMVIPSVIFYVAATKLMIKNNCNAFTINCFEICPDKRLAYKRKSTPCLTHTLLRDIGIPTSCEADMNLLMTVIAGMYISKKSMYMGNIFIKDWDQNILEILHDVPGLKMKGFDLPDLPYEIKNFTFSGFGVTIRYDFNRDKGEHVTIARFDPLGKRILVTEGKIVGGAGMDTTGCSLKVYIKLNNINDFAHKSQYFGNHSIMLYGLYADQFKKLGELMDFEVLQV